MVVTPLVNTAAYIRLHMYKVVRGLSLRKICMGNCSCRLLKFKEKEVSLGPVPLHEQQTTVVQLKNYGNAEASFRVRCRVCFWYSNVDLVADDRAHCYHQSFHGHVSVAW